MPGAGAGQSPARSRGRGRTGPAARARPRNPPQPGVPPGWAGAAVTQPGEAGEEEEEEAGEEEQWQPPQPPRSHSPAPLQPCHGPPGRRRPPAPRPRLPPGHPPALPGLRRRAGPARLQGEWGRHRGLRAGRGRGRPGDLAHRGLGDPQQGPGPAAGAPTRRCPGRERLRHPGDPGARSGHWGWGIPELRGGGAGAAPAGLHRDGAAGARAPDRRFGGGESENQRRRVGVRPHRPEQPRQRLGTGHPSAPPHLPAFPGSSCIS